MSLFFFNDDIIEEQRRKNDNQHIKGEKMKNKSKKMKHVHSRGQ